MYVINLFLLSKVSLKVIDMIIDITRIKIKH